MTQRQSNPQTTPSPFLGEAENLYYGITARLWNLSEKDKEGTELLRKALQSACEEGTQNA